MAAMENPEQAMMAKFEIMNMTRDLMPGGVPSYLEVIKFPMISQLTQEIGYQDMSKVLFLMVRDFCNNVNVVRNMTEDQMIEVAGMLLDECDNFRIEDYLMMFTLAKRGGLVKIMDRIDIQLISLILDKYYEIRRMAGERYYEEKEMEQKNKFYAKPKPAETTEEKEAEERFGKISKAFTEWKGTDDKRRDEELKKRQMEWAAQYANTQGIDVKEVINQFGQEKTKRDNHRTPIQQKVTEVFQNLKIHEGALDTLADRMFMSRDKVDRICFLKLTDNEIVYEFIGKGEALILELSQIS